MLQLADLKWLLELLRWWLRNCICSEGECHFPGGPPWRGFQPFQRSRPHPVASQQAGSSQAQNGPSGPLMLADFLFWALKLLCSSLAIHSEQKGLPGTTYWRTLPKVEISHQKKWDDKSQGQRTISAKKSTLLIWAENAFLSKNPGEASDDWLGGGPFAKWERWAPVPVLALYKLYF